MVDALAGYGKIFYKNTLSSGVIPQIAAINMRGRRGLFPGSDGLIYMVKNTSQMFITDRRSSKRLRMKKLPLSNWAAQ